MESYNADADNVTFNGTINADGSSISTSLIENVDASNTDNGERTTNVINSNTQTIIPENEGEVRHTEVYQHGFIGQVISEFLEYAHNEFRARPPLLNINLHKYEETNSTCPESKEHCSICLEDYSDKELLAKIDCGHMYHMDCLKEWNMIENNCPICKRRVEVVCHSSLRICAHLIRWAENNQRRSG